MSVPSLSGLVSPVSMHFRHEGVDTHLFGQTPVHCTGSSLLHVRNTERRDERHWALHGTSRNCALHVTSLRSARHGRGTERHGTARPSFLFDLLHYHFTMCTSLETRVRSGDLDACRSVRLGRRRIAIGSSGTVWITAVCDARRGQSGPPPIRGPVRAAPRHAGQSTPSWTSPPRACAVCSAYGDAIGTKQIRSLLL